MSCSGFPKACDLRTSVNIQRATLGEDAIGGRVKSWATIESPWVAWESNSGSENMYAGGRRSTSAHTITLRHTDLLASDRIEKDGTVYNIVFVLDIKQRGVWLKVGLAEGVPP